MDKENLKKHISSESISVLETMEMIEKNASGLIFVVDDMERLVGCVTDGDIRRWILHSGSLDAHVSMVMHKEPLFLREEEADKAYDFMREKYITALPIVDDEKCIVDIILMKEHINKRAQRNVLRNVPVIIMAGGKGTRLYPYTKILPKPLIPIGETPIVERIINCFLDFGIDRFYMTVNYKKEMIKAYFSETDKPYELEFVEEDKPLGTAGSLKLVKTRFEDPIIVTNCDSLILTDYSLLYEHHKKTNNDITMVSAVKKYTIPYGVISFGDNGEIISMDEKPVQSCFINTGMYVINPEVIELIPAGKMFHMPDLVEEVIKKGGKVGAYPVSEDSFLDMGEFDEMRRMEEKIKNASEQNYQMHMES